MPSYLQSTVNWDTIRSLTHPKVAQKVSDNITGKIPLLYFLNKMGNKEYENGGYNYMFPILKELKTGQFYTGASVLSTAEADPVTTAIYERKQFTVDIMATGTKMLQNSGNNPEAIVNYLAVLVEQAEESAKNTLDSSSVGIYSSLGESDFSGITGLQNINSATPTSGTTGGLDRAVYTWWQNQQVTCSTGFNTNGKASMDSLFYSCVRGDEAPTIGMATQSTYININRFLTATLSYSTSFAPKTMDGDIAFEHIYWHGVPIMFGSNVPANTFYFLNLKYMKLLVHGDRDMTIRDWITPSDQDALVARLYWAGNLVCTNLARQGVMTGSPDTF